jgi:hypothetical protein
VSTQEKNMYDEDLISLDDDTKDILEVLREEGAIGENELFDVPDENSDC